MSEVAVQSQFPPHSFAPASSDPVALSQAADCFLLSLRTHSPIRAALAMDILSHFEVLDELIQVIYQGFERFIVLSAVNESSWTVYVGLKGPEGRWWRGSWSSRDITQFIVRPAVHF